MVNNAEEDYDEPATEVPVKDRFRHLKDADDENDDDINPMEKLKKVFM